MEFSTMCRVCMQNISLDYVDLDTPFNETTYFECFNYCTKLEAKASDKLPKTICVSCATLLQNSYDFINAAVEADRIFHEYIFQLEDNYGDIKCIPEYEIESKEIIMLPNLSAESEIFLSESKSTMRSGTRDESYNTKFHHSKDIHEEYIEPIEDEGLQELQLEKNTKEEIINEQQKQNYYVDVVDTEKDLEINIEDTTINTEQPIFEEVESIDIGKPVNDLVEMTRNNQKELKSALRYILPKVETEPKEDPINIELKTEDIFVSSEDQQWENVFTLNHQENNSIIKCHICKKKIRKNYTDHMNQHTGNKAYECDKCDESFFTLKQYRIHKAQNHKRFKDAWFCNKCGEAFESRANLNTHQNNEHTNTTSGLCLTCGDILSDQEALEQHVKDNHWSRKCPVECTHCKKKYQLNTLPMHVKYSHSDVILSAADGVFTCKYCFKNFQESNQLEEHIKKHKGKHLYSCGICGQDFKGKGVFEDHKVSMHPTSNVNPKIQKCNKCDFTSTDVSLLVKHRKKHYNYNYDRIPKFLCSYCPKKFFTLKALNDHEDYQHGEQKTAHQCNLCGKKFYSNFKLQTHTKSAHENERPFMCKECPKAFKLRAQLLQHEKNHYGRKIDCPHCDKKFVQPCYLRVHLRTHTNELPYECHLCDKKFAIKVRLTYHLAKHEGIVRKCEYCPKAFDNMAKLRIHRFEHTGYPFVCDICKENHHKRESFIRHMKRHHQIMMTKEDVEENRLRNMKNFYRNPKL